MPIINGMLFIKGKYKSNYRLQDGCANCRYCWHGPDEEEQAYPWKCMLKFPKVEIRDHTWSPVCDDAKAAVEPYGICDYWTEGSPMPRGGETDLRKVCAEADIEVVRKMETEDADDDH